MSFKDIIGHEAILARLRIALQHERLPHALLFAGPDGIGKRRVALELAKVLNCRQPADWEPCDACLSCRKITQSLHPDVQVIAPVDSAYIRIEQIRQMREAAHYRPMEGRQRVFILDDAERMNVESANAALKTLEEPPETTLIILVTAHASSLLPTIRSRCQLLAFAPVPIPRITAWLQAQNQFAKPADAELAARLSQGSLGRARSLNLPAYKEVRQEAFLAAENVFIMQSFIEASKSAVYATKDRKGFEFYLDTLLILLRDALVFKYLKTMDLVINVDMRDALKRLAGHSSYEKLCLFIEQVTAVRRALDRNINRQLALESLLLDLGEAP